MQQFCGLFTESLYQICGIGHTDTKPNRRDVMEQEKNSGRERDALEEYGAAGLRTDDSDICTLAIIGQIEGH